MATLPVRVNADTEAKSTGAATTYDSYSKGSLAPTRGGADSSAGLIKNLSTETLAASLAQIKDSLQDLFGSIRQVGDFELGEIQLTLEVTASGGFALIGTAEVGAKGGITLTFKPPVK